MGEIVPLDPGDLGNTKRQISPAKKWCFTLNNPTNIERKYIDPILLESCNIAFYSNEVGDSGTEHLQGYVEFKTKKRPCSVFKDWRFHWEKARGTRQENLTYCTKEGELVFSMGLPRVPRVYSYIDLFPEQRQIVDSLKTIPDERTIHFCVAGYGKGKTSLARHIVYHLNAVILPTTKRHALSVVRNNTDCSIFIFDLTAEESCGPETEFFETLESLKNGLFCSGFGTKGTGPVIMDFPHIVVFTNIDPMNWDTCMDKERFKIVTL